MIKRELSKKIKGYLKSFPIVTITGPRQSGKTTLLKHLFPKRTYVSLEDPDKRAFAEEDPKRFLATFPAPVIFDEIQKVPRLFSYLQTLTDEIGKNGMYVLSGSQNFLLMEKISQSLAGRVGILSLLPFGFEELKNSKIVFGNNLDSVLFTGFYPRIWDKKLNAFDWYINYVQTYLERDVRQIKNVNNLRLFQRFLRLCAGRTGQILSLSSFANDCGISHNTANSWLSILEASYIIYLLPPYRKNFNKRLIKSPKLYFYDTGLACSLLGIENKRQLITHPLRGSLFETFVISELVKNRFNRGKIMNLSYFRDKSGHEIDCLIEEGGKIKAVEIKSGQTISSNFFKNLSYWQNLSKTDPKNSFVVYGGNEGQKRSLGTVVGWEKLGGLF
ncbi:ATP-binding protein [Patescibacteria group bacterium]|nr:ATP-binding protein [Patescibacteria group bacterium]MCG2702745.1 ATP-binding protein [Candidatus Parcubacteria bacterium]MBU4265445.1 ATP-binding protein [Patescibacteria group bacterium]MBU4390495.1 ATP-binding protein [Patescibacteria group bacterium]MBU4396935.1 ATP-binding protein [Patescibacteria group bacterium]